MDNIIRRVRGILGLGLIASGIGALLGASVGIWGMISDPGDYDLRNVLDGTLILGSFGLFCGAGFAGLLTASSGRLELAQVRRLRVTLLGILAGILPALLVYYGGIPDFLSLGEVLIPILGGGALGGLVGLGFTEIARRAPPVLTPGESAPNRPIHGPTDSPSTRTLPAGLSSSIPSACRSSRPPR